MARELDNPHPPTRLFLVDDEPVIRKGLRFLCGMEPNLEVCGEAETEQEALGGILALRPDLAVVDLSLKEGEGLALIRRLREHCSGLKILVFTMHDQAEFAAAAFAAGAHGYVVKEEGAEKLLEAIHMVMEGLRYLSAQVAAKAPGLGARMQGRGSAPP